MTTNTSTLSESSPPTQDIGSGEMAVFKQMDAAFGGGPAVHNFRGTAEQQMVLALAATTGGAESGQDLVGGEFAFVHWYVHPVDIVDEKTGEVVTCPRVVLIDKDGTAVQFVSHGVYQSLRVILQYIGFGQLSEPRRVAIKQKSTRKGRRILYLQPITG